MEKKNRGKLASEQAYEKDFDTDGGSLRAQNDESSIAVLSLHRLESDIRNLQSKWENVEQDLQARDAIIADLSSELELRQASLRSLHDELHAADEEHEKTLEAIAAANREVETLQSVIDEKDVALSERTREIKYASRRIDQAKGAQEEAVANALSLEASLEEQRKKNADTQKRISARDREIQELRVTIQDLESYVDGRRERWDELNAELDDYRSALVGMEKAIKASDADADAREGEAGELAGRIIELEQQIAVLDGRHAERILMDEQLQQHLDQRGREVETLTAELKGEQVSAEQQRGRIASLEAHIESLLADADRQRARVADVEERLLEATEAQKSKAAEVVALTADREESLEACRAEERVIAQQLTVERDALLQKTQALETELALERARAERLEEAQVEARTGIAEAKARIAGLEGDLALQQQQHTDLRENYDAHKEESVQLWSDLKQSLESLANANLRIAMIEAKSAQLESENHAYGEELGSLRNVLVKKDKSIARLEAKLEARRETIALLDRNAGRLSAIGNHVQFLDRQISGRAGANDSEGASLASGNGMSRAIIASSGKQKIRFPLNKKVMTIGRGLENDILLGWKYISRNHARITCNESGAKLEDLGSKNGIFVNSEPVRSVDLRNGDHVEIGKVEFEYIQPDQPAAAESEGLSPADPEAPAASHIEE